MRTNVALAAGLCLVMTAVTAHAQTHPENRGYGGPMYVGPNFEQGGQHAPPVYGKGQKATIERVPVKRPPPRDVAKSAKAPATHEAETPAAKETGSGSDTTTTVAAPATDDGTGSGTTADADTSSAAKTCKKFEPTAGRTVDVPCD